MSAENDSRLRASTLLTSIDKAVDSVMARLGVKVPSGRFEAFVARAEFLERAEAPLLLDGSMVQRYRLRSAYVHLRETLGDMATEPVLIDPRYEKWVNDFMAALKSI